jgi:hypothetical protein
MASSTLHLHLHTVLEFFTFRFHGCCITVFPGSCSSEDTPSLAFLLIRWPFVLSNGPHFFLLSSLHWDCPVMFVKIPTTTRFLIQVAYFQSEIPPPLALFLLSVSI